MHSSERSLRYAAFIEVKWFLKGWLGGQYEFDGLGRVKDVDLDLAKLQRHLQLGRCDVAAMLIVDDEGLFEQRTSAVWPEDIVRLVVSPAELKRRGIVA
jgi:hypothetical protein